MKKVLLLGDSIRQNYQDKVVEELKDVYAEGLEFIEKVRAGK